MSRLYDEFVTVLGDIKLFRFPFWVVYDPGSYKIRGPEMRTILGLVKPGDIVLRRYDGYLDSHIITGTFSHASLFLGEVTVADAVVVPEGEPRSMSFCTGPAQIAHSTAEGVHLEEILTFLQCDGVAILRFPEVLEKLSSPPPRPADFAQWHDDEKDLYNRLDNGEKVPFADVFATARSIALGTLGTPYDFSFNFNDGNRLSCTEFVAHVYRSALPALGVVPTRQSFLGGLRHEVVIRPDDFLKTALPRVHVSPQAQLLIDRAK